MATWERVCLCGLLMTVFAPGCTPKDPPGGVIVGVDPARDLATARRHNDEATELMRRGNLTGAEDELKASLAADPTFGMAHNNLGIVYYRQKNYYAAAREFQLAGTFMPGKWEPRNNLGMVYEAAGKLDDAARSYQEASAIDPDCMEIVANLARVHVRMNRTDRKTRELLEQIVMKDTRPDWVAWARQRLAIFGAASNPATEPATQE